MFSLIDSPEREIDINGKVYLVNDDFDNILKVFELIEKNQNLLGIELAIYQLIGTIPNLEAKQMIKLYTKLMQIYVNDGDKQKVERDLQGNIIPVKNEEWFSFKYDAWAIYAGFMQTYHIDLKKEKLRWCDFKALLNGLPSDTRFKEMIEIRQRPYPDGKGTSKQRASLRKAKEAVSYEGKDFT